MVEEAQFSTEPALALMLQQCRLEAWLAGIDQARPAHGAQFRFAVAEHRLGGGIGGEDLSIQADQQHGVQAGLE